MKAGAAHPETNAVTRPFNQEEYEKYRTLWLEGLRRPEGQWRLVLKPDHLGQHIAHDPASGRPRSKPLRWELAGAELRLVYPEETKIHTFTCRVVSSHELHYPLQPLGGWFVLRRP